MSERGGEGRHGTGDNKWWEKVCKVRDEEKVKVLFKGGLMKKVEGKLRYTGARRIGRPAEGLSPHLADRRMRER